MGKKLPAQTPWRDRGTKTMVYCQRIVCRRFCVAALRTVKLGLTKFLNQSNHWSILKKVGFHTNLEQTFKRTATDLDTQLTTTCELKHARLLRDVCCCLNNTGKKILIRINWLCVSRSVAVRLNVIYFFPMPPHVPCGLRGLPSRLWPKCNRLLRLGCPWGAVTLSRWGGWWYMNMKYQEGP
jgi:hypothetical protein